MNPYKTNRTQSAPTPHRAPTPPRNASNGRQRGQNGGVKNAPPYASDMLNGATPEFGQGQQRNRQQSTQHPHRGRHVRNQRQFGTSVEVSLDSGMTDELRDCMAAFSTDARKEKGRADDDVSDVSSSSSDDEELLSFSMFGNK